MNRYGNGWVDVGLNRGRCGNGVYVYIYVCVSHVGSNGGIEGRCRDLHCRFGLVVFGGWYNTG